jgi:DNA-binding NarL/FixJ family response regulator
MNDFCRCLNPTLTRRCLFCGRIRLAPRELEVVEGLRRAKSNREIAAQMGVSLESVKQYVQRIFLKLDCHNRTELAVMASKSKTAGVA